MARVTVEDCLDNVDNRFSLVLIAAKRARQIAGGKEALVDQENDKPTVVALREIADGLIDSSILDEQPEDDYMEEEILAAETDALNQEMSATPSDAEPSASELDVAAAIKAALAGSMGASSDDSSDEEGGE